jgi:glycosyltransferase involved in cell wall biosynthesis
MYDLSVIITARNEEFLPLTVEDVLNQRRGNTEIIVVSDGGWPCKPIKDHADVTMIEYHESIGQRAAINQAAALSKAKYIMKLDAHCRVDEGFDIKLMADCDYDWTVVPRLYNLHVFDWKCNICGNVTYQGPTPTVCTKCNDPKSKEDGGIERVMVWKPRWNRKSDFMRFDSNLHFQYWGELGNRPESKGDIADNMSLLGACFFMHRKRYWELGGSDEEHGSWGQQGTEIACKAWLSGGKLVVNKKTWYSHLFRTQGGDFGFPYQLSGRQVDHAREHSKNMWLNNKWEKQVRPLSWLVEHFYPVPGWSDEELGKLKEKAKTFHSPKPQKGIIFYTDNQLNLKIAHKVQKQLKKIGLPIVSASLKPMGFGDKNVTLPLQRGVLTMFKQILAALEASDAEIVYFCEHDCLYSPSHFDFTPPRKDVWYYNENVWKVDSKTGRALHYDCKQVSGICVYRELAIKHYRKRIEMVEKSGYTSRMGYEPGTHHRPERVDDSTAEGFKSAYPNVDIRHDGNLSPTRWNKEEFRNQKNTQGWIEGTIKDIPGWPDLRLP